MEKDLLRKVQLAQLEIAKEIKRVCDENDIQYFLAFGSMIGAVRHKGFIPWDDDMDLGMVRSEYERFLEIAPKKMKPEYFLQTWYSDPSYPLPFAKVRKRGTLFLESKGAQLKENGFFVDIFPYDFVPATKAEKDSVDQQRVDLCRTMLMKCKFTPWMENDSIIWKKRIGYLYYQLKAVFASGRELARKHDALVSGFPENDKMFWQDGTAENYTVHRSWCEDLSEYEFEGEWFKGPTDYDAVLRDYYGDYMKFPPESERENRHQIVAVDFGE